MFFFLISHIYLLKLYIMYYENEGSIYHLLFNCLVVLEELYKKVHLYPFIQNKIIKSNN